MSIPLPAPAIRLHGKRGKQISPELIGFFDDGQMHAHAAAVSAAKDAEIAGLRERVAAAEQASRWEFDLCAQALERIKVLEDALTKITNCGKTTRLVNIKAAARAALGDKNG